ncbi:MAG: SGNH/GDSL hydrolase family protein [Nitrosomonas ureae]
MINKIKPLLVNLIVLFVSVLFALTIGELTVRMIVPRTHHQLFCQYDALLGWKHIPHSSALYQTKEYAVRENFNSRGLRGPEYVYGKQPDEFRIFILGDSFAEGYTVEFDELFSEVLNKKLNETDKGNLRYQVINTGVAGYSTDQQLLLYQSEGKKYGSNLVVLLFYYNDILANLGSRAGNGNKPKFQLEFGELKLTNVPVPKPRKLTVKSLIESKNRSELIHSVLSYVKQWLKDNTRLYTLIIERVPDLPFLYELMIKLHLARPFAQNESNGVPDEFRVFEKNYSTSVRSAWKITEELIKELHEEAADVDSDLLVVNVPFRAAVYEESWASIKNRFGISDENWSPYQVSLELASICKKNGVEFFDPTALFREKAGQLNATKELLYFKKDGHWNKAGHHYMGEILTDYIFSHYSPGGQSKKSK